MSSASPPGGWRADLNLVWTQFDDGDDWVVYHPASGDVHHLTDAAHRLFMMIATGEARSIDELTDRFAAALGRPSDDDLARAVIDSLALMDRAGLIRPVRGAGLDSASPVPPAR